MTPPSTNTPKDLDVRDYLAAEQTFLAWIRTGIALMGFGFVVARFGLFLQQVRMVEPGLQTHSYGLSTSWIFSRLGAMCDWSGS